MRDHHRHSRLERTQKVIIGFWLPGGKLEDGSGFCLNGCGGTICLNGCGGHRTVSVVEAEPPPFTSERGRLLRGDADEAVSAYRPLIESTELARGHFYRK